MVFFHAADSIFNRGVDTIISVNLEDFIARFEHVYTYPLMYKHEMCTQFQEIIQLQCQNKPKAVYALMEQGGILSSLEYQCRRGMSAISDYQVENCILTLKNSSCETIADCFSPKQLRHRSKTINKRMATWMTLANAEVTATYRNDTQLSLADWVYAYNVSLFQQDLSRIPLGGSDRDVVADAVLTYKTNDQVLDRRREWLYRHYEYVQITQNMTAKDVHEITNRTLLVNVSRCRQSFVPLLQCTSNKHDFRQILTQYQLCLNGYYAAVDDEPEFMACAVNYVSWTSCPSVQQCFKSHDGNSTDLQPMARLRKRFFPALAYFLTAVVSMSIVDLFVPVLLVTTIAAMIMSYLLFNMYMFDRFKRISHDHLASLNNTQFLVPSAVPGANDRGSTGIQYDPFNPNRIRNERCHSELYWGSCGIPTSTQARTCPDGGQLVSSTSCSSFYRFSPGSLMCGMRPGDPTAAQNELTHAVETWRNSSATRFQKMRYRMMLPWKFMCQSLCIKYSGPDCVS
jgi:hypothetical protein